MPSKLWTALENFTETTSPSQVDCTGCHGPITKGLTCLIQHVGVKKQTVIALHNSKCWELWEQSYWLAKARYRQQLIKKGSGRSKALALGGYPLKGGVRV